MLAMLMLLNVASLFTTYLNSNYVYDLHIEEMEMFWATTGGVVRFKVADSTYIKYDNTDGLISNFVTDIEKDETGNRFFSHWTSGLTQLTQEGAFIRFHMSDLGLQADTITCLLIDEDKMIIGTNAGFSFDGIFLDAGNSGLTNARINVMKRFGDTLWFGTNGGVDKVHIDRLFAADEWSSYTVAEGLPSNKVLDISPSSGRMWAATDGGVGRFNGVNWDVVNQGLPSEIVRRIASRAGALYVGTDSGVAEWVLDRWEPRNEGLAVTEIRAMAFDSDGSLWVGTYGGGIARLNGVWRVYRSPGPRSNFINDVLIDRDGGVWCTHFEPWNPESIKPYALSRFQQGQWTAYGREDFGDMGNFRFSAVDRGGNRWFTCYGYGLLEYTNADSFRIYNDSNSGLRGNNTSFPLVDKYNNRFFSVYVAGGIGEGISILSSDDSTWSFISRDNYTKAIWAMALDSTYGLWLGSEMTPIIARIDLSISLVDPPDEAWWTYSSGAIPTYAISVDRDNCVWIGTSNGIRVLKDTILERSYTTRNSPLLSDEVMDIEFDLEGSAIIATRDGLNILHINGVWEAYRTQDGLPSNQLRALALNRSTGDLWIGSDRGLCRYDSGIFPDPTLRECYTFPNPFIISQHNYVVFHNTAGNATIRIYTLSGSPVRELMGNRWDGRDQHGQEVSSGIYVYTVNTEAEKKAGKLAVIK